MKISLKRNINILIVLSFIGMFFSFPYQDSLIGGILFAAFTAATVGGLADSFAVSALFGQPLRIPWPQWMGTNIISRNRKRLIDELSDMVEHELLATEMIQRQIKEINIAQTLGTYIQSPSGGGAIKQLVRKILHQLVQLSTPSVVSLAIKRMVLQGISNSEPVKFISKLLHWMLDEGHDTVIIKEMSKQLKRFVEQKAVEQFVHDFIATALRSYEHNKKGRQFVNGLAGLNAGELTVKVMNIASSTLSELEKGDHPWNEKLRTMLLQLLDEWEHSDEAAERWNERFRKIGEFLMQWALSAQNIENVKKELLKQLEDSERDGDARTLVSWLEQKLDESLHVLAAADKQQQLNDYLITSLNSLIERYHRYIGLLVRGKLEQFDEKQLIELVEEKAGKDLQFIRLNGTLVGALIGILLYLIQYLLGGLLT